jgi:RHS repeat-associated protein
MALLQALKIGTIRSSPSCLSEAVFLLAALASPGLGAERIRYVHTDALGSIRALTDEAGNVVERHDYLPFGEEWCGTAACGSTAPGQPRRFTGKERDVETGLDYFGARYLQPGMGRFTATDSRMSMGEATLNPQKWNRYTYALSNPFRYVDPDGREEITVTINAFIPSVFVTTPWPMKGDGRTLFEAGTSRTTQRIVVETDPAKSSTGFVSATVDTGTSVGVGDRGILTTGKAPTDGLGATVRRETSGDVTINTVATVPYPNMPVPDFAAIRYNLSINVSDRQGQVAVTVTGSHTRFPAFEVIAHREGSNAGQAVYGRLPGTSRVAPATIMLPPRTISERKVLDK